MRQLLTRTPAPRRSGSVLSATVISVGIASLFLNPVSVGDSLATAAETAGNFSTETAGVTTSSPTSSVVEVGGIVSDIDSGGDQGYEDDAYSVDSGIAVGTSAQDSGVGSVDDGNSVVSEEPTGTAAPATAETSVAPATPAAAETSVVPETSAAPATSSTVETSTEETTTSTTHREVGGIMNWHPGDRARSGGGEPDQSAEPEPAPPPAPNPPSAAPAPQVSVTPTPPAPNPPSAAAPQERGRPEVGAVAGRAKNGPPEALARTGANLDTLLWLSVIVMLIGGAAVFTDRRWRGCRRAGLAGSRHEAMRQRGYTSDLFVP